MNHKALGFLFFFSVFSLGLPSALAQTTVFDIVSGYPPATAILLPQETYLHNVKLQMGANETPSDNVLIINVMYDAGKGWNYSTYTAELDGVSVVFDVSENDVNVSGTTKHRVTFTNSTLTPPSPTSPKILSLTVNLTSPNVSTSTSYSADVVAMWSFPATGTTQTVNATTNVTVSPDTDGDGMLDIDDACPTQAENFNGYQDTDGCPDSPPTGGGGGGGGGAPKCIKEGFQSLDVTLMKCLLREARLQYKQFYTDIAGTPQPKTIKLLASVLAITGEKTGEYPLPSLDVEGYLSKSVEPLEGDIFDLVKERILKRWIIASTVVVARGDLEVDSLAAVAYAKANGIPILLTKTDEIPSQTIDVLKKLGPKKIIIAGGPVAVSEKVEKELASFGNVERVYGNTRVETAVELAKSMEEKHEIKTIIIADGWGTSPEIAIIANNYKAPVVYVSGNEIPEVTKEFLEDHKRTKRYKRTMKVVFVGVGEEIQKEIEEIMKA